MRVRAVVLVIIVAAGSLGLLLPISGVIGQSPDVDVALSGIDSIDAARLIDRADADPWVRSRLDGTRYRAVEVLDPGDGKSGAIVSFFDYTNTQALQIEFSIDGTTIVDRRVSTTNPNFSPAEEGEAASIALTSSGTIERTGGKTMVVNNITGVTRGECSGRRCLAVFLTTPDGDYGTLVIAVVDLGKQEVIGFE